MPQVRRWFNKQRYLGLYRAIVVDVADPQQSKRVKFSLPSLNTSSWAPTLRNLGGTPQVGDQILVGFEAGDLNLPYVVGVFATGPTPAEVPIDASAWRFSGVVKADAIVANSIVAASYSSPAGNIW
ncbi:MAG: hypothetical protein QOJ80_3892 [Mycobacterium sp.]|nr:hypothetical protein [Mycobacterium sp.]